jgi:hypothetical protein
MIRKGIDSYSIKYWRKNKKDSDFLSKFSSAQNKIFKPLVKLNPKKRSAILLGLVLTYLTIDYMRFGLLQMMAASLVQILNENSGGIQIGV